MIFDVSKLHDKRRSSLHHPVIVFKIKQLFNFKITTVFLFWLTSKKTYTHTHTHTVTNYLSPFPTHYILSKSSSVSTSHAFVFLSLTRAGSEYEVHGARDLQRSFNYKRAKRHTRKEEKNKGEREHNEPQKFARAREACIVCAIADRSRLAVKHARYKIQLCDFSRFRRRRRCLAHFVWVCVYASPEKLSLAFGRDWKNLRFFRVPRAVVNRKWGLSAWWLLLLSFSLRWGEFYWNENRFVRCCREVRFRSVSRVLIEMWLYKWMITGTKQLLFSCISIPYITYTPHVNLRCLRCILLKHRRPNVIDIYRAQIIF